MSLLLAYAMSFAACTVQAASGTHEAQDAAHARQRDVLAWVKTVRDRRDAEQVCGKAYGNPPTEGSVPPIKLPDSLRRSDLLAQLCGDAGRSAGPASDDIADE